MGSASIFLVGPMGAGKTAVGRELARRRGLRFLDSDQEIQQRTGVDIPFIFEKEGEAGFRERESGVIEDLTALPRIVLATGGGVVTRECNRRWLTQRGTVVYLHASVRQQAERTRYSRDRPLLYTDDPEAKLRELFTVRDPLYRQIAALVVDTDGCRVKNVVDEICRHLAAHEGD